jgi:hypothetical protein
MVKHFYRKLGICAITTCLASFTLAQVANESKVKPRTEPRAISVLEMDAKGHARMVPVTILYQDRYYDASQYQSNPVPMALESGNVYDVLQSNTVVGLFTTGTAEQLHGNWIGLGNWKEKGAEPEKKPAKVEVTVPGGSGDDHPVLKRHQSSSDSNSKPKSDDDPDRPTLKRPESSAPDKTSAASDSTPTLAKRSAAPVDQDLTRDTNETDPDRPVLRKTKAGVNPTNVDVKMTPPVGAAQKAAPAKIAPQPGAEQWKQYVAISDEQKTDYRPFTYDLKPEEKTKFAAGMQKVAALSLQKWALAHGGAKLSANINFSDFDLRAFDVDYSNNPELVYTASYTPAAVGKAKPITYYVTVVARGDANDDLNPLFSQITDSTRLDAYSRLELIDAVDPDGYGRGSLLFREYTDSGRAFILYRVDSYNLTKLFEGASGE